MRFTQLMTSAAVALALGGAAAAQNNEAYVDQIGDSNSFTASQYNSNLSVGSEADPVLQEGDGNSFSSNQRFSSSNSTIGLGGDGVEQVGDNNGLGIAQTNGGSKTVGEVLQYGDLNRLGISQNGGSGSVLESARQIGNDNVMRIVQGGGFGNTILSAVQDGSNNGISLVNFDAGEATFIRQSGEQNLIENVLLEGDNNGAGNESGEQTQRIRQIGDFNTIYDAVTLGSNGGGREDGPADLDILQEGAYNEASIIQGQDAFSFDNIADVDQLGEGNTLFATILGDAFVQDGSENTLSALQDGNNNSIFGSQTGDANTAIVTQTGDGNVANVLQ